jgi:hypothetical protein
MDFGIAKTGIARGSPPGTTTEVLRVGFPSAEIRFVSQGRAAGERRARAEQARSDGGGGERCARMGEEELSDSK